MLLAFWPFDFSFSGGAFILFLLFWWFMYATASAARGTVNIAKKVANSEIVKEVAKEVGKAAIEAQVDSILNKNDRKN
jgi:hypothetical protein